MKQHKKVKICFVIHIAGERKLLFYIYCDCEAKKKKLCYSLLPVPTFGTDVNLPLTFTYVPKSGLRPQVGTGRFRKNPKISFVWLLNWEWQEQRWFAPGSFETVRRRPGEHTHKTRVCCCACVAPTPPAYPHHHCPGRARQRGAARLDRRVWRARRRSDRHAARLQPADFPLRPRCQVCAPTAAPSRGSLSQLEAC